MAERDPETTTDAAQTVGERLRADREAQGIELSEIAARTRVPQRHLEAIERGDYGALPAMTYATGFARAYARAIGSDEVALARDLRGELAQVAGTPEYVPYAAADPARVPPRWLAWGGALAALLVLALAGWWYANRDPLPEEAVTAATAEDTAAGSAGGAPAGPAPVAAAAPGGPVVLTAREPVWVRVYDAGDARLLEKEMAAGERYQVPADANRPMILTGRPDVVAITVGGRAIPPLGDGSRSVSGIELTAQALLQRAGGAPGAGAAAAAP